MAIKHLCCRIAVVAEQQIIDIVEQSECATVCAARPADGRTNCADSFKQSEPDKCWILTYCYAIVSRDVAVLGLCGSRWKDDAVVALARRIANSGGHRGVQLELCIDVTLDTSNVSAAFQQYHCKECPENQQQLRGVFHANRVVSVTRSFSEALAICPARTGPTPSGVPVKMQSPARSVKTDDR